MIVKSNSVSFWYFRYSLIRIKQNTHIQQKGTLRLPTERYMLLMIKVFLKTISSCIVLKSFNQDIGNNNIFYFQYQKKIINISCFIVDKQDALKI